MNFIAELRNWIKTADVRDTFQGYIFNDSAHEKDGTFKTIEADEVLETTSGLVVTVKNHAYYLWNSFKRGA